MYSHLSSKEKKKKLAQARKRAINWSAQQQILSKRNTTSKSQKTSAVIFDKQTKTKQRDFSQETP